MGGLAGLAGRAGLNGLDGWTRWLGGLGWPVWVGAGHTLLFQLRRTFSGKIFGRFISFLLNFWFVLQNVPRRH